MDVIAHRTLERPDVEAHRAGCNPRQHGSCLARGTKWSQDDHDAIALVQAGALQNSQSPLDTGGDGDGASMEPSRSPPLVNFAHFQMLMNWQGGI